MPRFKIKHEFQTTRMLHFISPLVINRRRSHICREREMDSQRRAYSLQEDTALTLFRAKLHEAESAAARAGAAAGLNQMETEVHASVLSVEYHAGPEKVRTQHRSEYLEIRRVLDEQICEQKNSIEVTKKRSCE